MLKFRKKYPFLNAAAGDEGGSSGGAAASGDNPGAAAGAGGPDGHADDTAQKELETRARAMGWTSKDEFKGDPAKWRDAGEFVERGENLLPLVKAQNKRLEREVAELKQTTKEFAEHLSKTEQRAYDRAIADLKQQRKEALAAGDGDAFEKADEQIDKLQRDAAAKAAKHAEKKDDGGADPVYTEWESRNPWLKDAELSEYAEFAAQKLRTGGERATGAEFLDLVAQKVKAQFPAKFTNPRRETAQAVEGAAPARRSGGKAYADMPAEARAACDRMAKNGFAGDEKAQAKFKADYVKQYFEEA
jgi:hypothetical protein